MVPPPTPPPDLLPGQQLLVYTPDGPLGGTFACVHCRAQAWQPDLLVHAAGCPAQPPAPMPRPPMTRR
jgi:hypothetical protein